MDLRETVGDRDRLARTLLAVGLSAVAIGSLRKGKRLSGLLAGGGALALGYTATAGSGELEELDELTDAVDVGTSEEDTTGRETTDEGVELRCAACGEPIGPGETRGPNADNEIVHLDCK